MTKLFSNQSALILWAGRGVGRAVALALARNEGRVIVSDPDAQALQKLAELLKSKDVEIVVLPWHTRSGEADECAREARRILEEVRLDTPFLHRIVVALGLDERFFSGPISSEETETTRLSRLESLVEACLAELKKQSRPGALDVFWPSENPPEADPNVGNAPATEALIRSGLECLRRLAAKAASMGVPMSILRVCLLEPSETTGEGAAKTGNYLRPGEIGEAWAHLASLPKNLVIPEALLAPRSK
jgi:hypothetical protein